MLSVETLMEASYVLVMKAIWVMELLALVSRTVIYLADSHAVNACTIIIIVVGLLAFIKRQYSASSSSYPCN